MLIVRENTEAVFSIGGRMYEGTPREIRDARDSDVTIRRGPRAEVRL